MTTKPSWPADYDVRFDHCATVLSGAYDVPFNPATPPVILDLGANVGAFTLWAVKRWPGCTIHAYEPQPNNFALLTRTVAELTEAERANVHLYDVAVGSRAGIGTLHEGEFNCGEWSMIINAGKSSIQVPVISALSLPKADILKMDTEGCEAEILATLHERIADFSAVMMEVHNTGWVTPIKALMARGGFALTGDLMPYPNRYELKYVKAALLP